VAFVHYRTRKINNIIFSYCRKRRRRRENEQRGKKEERRKNESRNKG